MSNTASVVGNEDDPVTDNNVAKPTRRSKPRPSRPIVVTATSRGTAIDAAGIPAAAPGMRITSNLSTVRR
jgi:hypothetical protein